VVLSFSSISTGGFSPGSASVNEMEIERPYKIRDEQEGGEHIQALLHNISIFDFTINS